MKYKIFNVCILFLSIISCTQQKKYKEETVVLQPITTNSTEELKKQSDTLRPVTSNNSSRTQSPIEQALAILDKKNTEEILNKERLNNLFLSQNVNYTEDFEPIYTFTMYNSFPKKITTVAFRLTLKNRETTAIRYEEFKLKVHLPTGKKVSNKIRVSNSDFELITPFANVTAIRFDDGSVVTFKQEIEF